MLKELLTAGHFDEAIGLSAQFNRETREHTVARGQPVGMPLVAHEIGAYCIYLDQAGSSGAIIAVANSALPHDEWRRLRRLLGRHDSRARNYDAAPQQPEAACVPTLHAHCHDGSSCTLISR